MQIDVTPILMGDPITASRRPPTDREMERAARGPSDKDYWTRREEDLLRFYYARDWTFEAIARLLGRSRHECSMKARRIDLPARAPRKVGFKGWRRRRVG